MLLPLVYRVFTGATRRLDVLCLLISLSCDYFLVYVGSEKRDDEKKKETPLLKTGISRILIVSSFV